MTKRKIAMYGTLYSMCCRRPSGIIINKQLVPLSLERAFLPSFTSLAVHCIASIYQMAKGYAMRGTEDSG